MSSQSFDNLVRKTVAYEMTPKKYEEHPDLGAFLAVLASDVSDEARGAVVAHVATCPSCRAKWQAVKQTLTARQERLEARTEGPGLADLVRERSRAREPARASQVRLARWPTFRLGPVLRPVLVPVFASAAAVAITLGVMLPRFGVRDLSAVERLASLTREVEALREDTRTLASALAQSGTTIPANILRPKVSADDLAALRDQAEGIRDPWQRALYVASVLNRWGIEPSVRVNWQAPEPYIVRSGDTWQVLAARHLGDRDAWPVLWLLNTNASPPGQDPPVGTTVFLPAPSK